MQVLVTGATGKVGREFIARLLRDPVWSGARVLALCHNRSLDETDRLRVLRASISDPEAIDHALESTTHVVHLATVKESPDDFIDVSVKGMFHLLEAFRRRPQARQFLLVGGDCVVGHCFVPWREPITENSQRRSYPGVYALSKVIEEVMLEQYGIQYGVNWTVLRAPWIMEKDDFRYALSFGPDQFGGPDWNDLISDELRRRYAATNCVPVLLDKKRASLKRNFIHVSDLASAMLLAMDNPSAIQQTFNVAMTQPVDYAVVGDYLSRTRRMTPVAIETGLYSNLLDNSKARLNLGWTPAIETEELIDLAFNYVRDPGDQRKVWYVG